MCIIKLKVKDSQSLKGGKMSSISDVIEQFILSTMAEDKMVELSRNDLAKYFSCECINISSCYCINSVH